MTNTASSSTSKQSQLHSLIAGVCAGALTTIICSPLDVAKIRIQVQGSMGITKYKGTLSSIRTIFLEEGAKGLFRGIAPALITVPTFWGIYFYTYNSMKQHLSDNQLIESRVLTHVASAVSAGAIGDVVCNPLFVARTRIQTLVLHQMSSNQGVVDKAPNLARLMINIYRQEGWLAFYKGLGASILGLSHVGLQFPLYEHIKKLARDRRQATEETAIEIIVSSILAKLVATVVTYPHEVLRSRLQDSSIPSKLCHHGGGAGGGGGIVAMTKHIIEKEGVGALWSGIRLNVIRVIPATISTFLGYEYISRYLKIYFPLTK